MKKIMITAITLTFLICLSSSVTLAKSDFLENFENMYKLLDADLMNHDIEKFAVQDFVYNKDIATFQFQTGNLYLLRYINDRPTTAIFIGTGKAEITIPNEAERYALESVSGKQSVSEEFKVCIMRIADDFDIAVKENFKSEIVQLSWDEFNTIKEEQADFFFKPIIQHTYDNYFQQTRSLYNRNADGLFWIDFNRYNFLYDPNQPYPVQVGYEFETNDFDMTYPVRLPANVTTELSNYELSNVRFQATPLGYEAEIILGGLDGQRLESARSDMRLVIDADSLMFLNTFLHYNLNIDSIYVNGSKIEYHRRKDFRFVALVFPEFVHKGDTLVCTYWYSGKNFDYVLPYLDNKIPVEHSFTFKVPKGYNYIMPGMSEVTREGRYDQFTANPQLPCKEFYFRGMATNFDTLTYTSQIGMPINMIKSKSMSKQVNCFVPETIYDSSIINAFNFMTSRVGAPIGTFGIYVFPDGFQSMPGMVQVPHALCYDPGYTNAFGGFNIFTGHSMAKQWFGHQMRSQSERETWIEYAAPEYLSLMFIQSLDDKAYYSNLALHRDSLEKFNGHDMLRPIYLGNRATDINLTNKGLWLFHMLRYQMLDIESGNSEFNKFFSRLAHLTNGKQFTNKDIVDLAESYYGEDLDWFFNQWLFDYKIPHFDVTYSIQSGGSQHFVDVEIETSNSHENFKYPVIFSIVDKQGNPTLIRENITKQTTKFKFGPFDFEPKEMVFNELFSVLCSEKINKK